MSTSVAASQGRRGLRASHRKVLQLFRLYGPQTDAEAFESAKAEGWDVSPSGLRSRRSELTPPRGRGIRDSGKKRNHSTVWELDPESEL